MKKQQKEASVMGKITFSYRNSPNKNKNTLTQFERFHSILLSLRDSTGISVEIENDQIRLSNTKYYLIAPLDIAEILLNKVVLRREELTTVNVVLLFPLCYEWGRVDAQEVDPPELPYLNRVIVINDDFQEVS